MASVMPPSRARTLPVATIAWGTRSHGSRGCAGRGSQRHGRQLLGWPRDGCQVHLGALIGPRGEASDTDQCSLETNLFAPVDHGMEEFLSRSWRPVWKWSLRS